MKTLLLGLTLLFPALLAAATLTKYPIKTRLSLTGEPVTRSSPTARVITNIASRH